MLPPDIYPEGIPFVDARPPQDNGDRLQDDSYLKAVAGGMGVQTGGKPVYGSGQPTPIGGVSPQDILVDPIPKGTPPSRLVEDSVTLRTGLVTSSTGGVTPTDA
jgi:hypothetical protein